MSNLLCVSVDKDNVFDVLGVYGKETVISNMLAWAFNPVESHGLGFDFLNDFLNFTGCRVVNETSHVRVIREYYGKSNERRNFIDIVIVEEDENRKPVHVVGIENKVFSSEGYKQTERYQNIIAQDFSQYNCVIDCLYLTKNNFPVMLSGKDFKHFRYDQLKCCFDKFTSNRMIHDFYEAYILKDERRASELNGKSFDDYGIEEKLKITNELCFYLSYVFNKLSSDIYCEICNSAHGGKVFYRAWKQCWNLNIHGISYNVHIEGYFDKVYLHFETVPYTPYSKLDQDIKETMTNKRNELRAAFKALELPNGFERKPIRKNAVLTIANLKITASSFSEYYKLTRDLAKAVDTCVYRFRKEYFNWGDKNETRR